MRILCCVLFFAFLYFVEIIECANDEHYMGSIFEKLPHSSHFINGENIFLEYAGNYERETNRSCLKLPNKYSSVKPNIKNGKCKKWQCWDSQLTLINKQVLLNMYNDFRREVAKGNCKLCSPENTISNMIKLKWHWSLEIEAMKIASECLRQTHKKEHSRRNVQGLDTNLLCESASVPFGITTSTQFEFFQRLIYALDMNGLNDFEGSIFQRGTALYIGCAVAARDHVTMETGLHEHVKDYSVMHLACIYCTKESKMQSIYDDLHDEESCPGYTTKEEDGLCKPEDKTEDIFACECTSACSGSPPTETWEVAIPGIVEELIPLKTNQGNIAMLNVTHVDVKVESGKHVDVAYNWSINLQEWTNLGQHIPPWLYNLDKDEIELYNEALQAITDGYYVIPGPGSDSSKSKTSRLKNEKPTTVLAITFIAIACLLQ